MALKDINRSHLERWLLLPAYKCVHEWISGENVVKCV